MIKIFRRTRIGLMLVYFVWFPVMIFLYGLTTLIFPPESIENPISYKSSRVKKNPWTFPIVQKVCSLLCILNGILTFIIGNFMYYISINKPIEIRANYNIGAFIITILLFVVIIIGETEAFVKRLIKKHKE